MNPTSDSPFLPRDRAVYDPRKMGKATLFESPRVLVGLNAFEPGQSHPSHAHAGADKVYWVLEGEGAFTVGEKSHRVRAGEMLVAPAGVAHGVVNDGAARLLVLAVIAPAPQPKS
jgi:quercetin dioxygenase-like cupin family protein